MSHKPHYQNIPQSESYFGRQPENSSTKETYPMIPHENCQGLSPGQPLAPSRPLLPPEAHPIIGMQNVSQPGFQPGASQVYPVGYPEPVVLQPGPNAPSDKPLAKPPLPPGVQPMIGMQNLYQPGFPPGPAQVHPGGYPEPVVQQPGHNAPSGPINCPRGLEYLALIDKLLVHQKVEVLEVVLGFETNNKYTVKNSVGEKVYYAVEDNDCCTRNCCGPLRPFDMKIFDNFRNEVIHLNRPLACGACCCPCCLQSVEVSAPPGTVIGTIEQEWSIWNPKFVVKNAAGDIVLRIKGPCLTCAMCSDVKFKVLTKDGEHEVGKISKHWSGFIREAFTDADNFSVSFPLDLDVKTKALLLGALFLIDFMYFEKAAD